MRTCFILWILSVLVLNGCDDRLERARKTRGHGPRDTRCDAACRGRLVTCESLATIAGPTGHPDDISAYDDAFEIVISAAEYDDGVACDGDLLVGFLPPSCIPSSARIRVCGHIGWSNAESDDDVEGGPRRMYSLRLDPAPSER